MEGRSRSYKSLIIWQKAMELTKEVYDLTKNFPKEELYGLTLQIRKSAISIPSNIAEGKGRKTRKEFIRFLQYSLGSLYELQTQIELSKELGYIKSNPLEEKCFELEKMINSLISVKRKGEKSSTFNLPPST